MQVSMYITPRSQQCLTSAMLETSTDRFTRKSPRPMQPIEHAPEILAHQRLDDETHAQRLRLGLARFFGRDDHDALGADADMPQDQRQHALADAAEADHDRGDRETRHRPCDSWL